MSDRPRHACEVKQCNAVRWQARLPLLDVSQEFRATRTEPWQIGRMFTYDVTATGPMGFQVSLARPYPHDTRLIGDFCSLQEAEAFANKMREIDAGPSYITMFDPQD